MKQSDAVGGQVDLGGIDQRAADTNPVVGVVHGLDEHLGRAREVPFHQEDPTGVFSASRAT